MEVGRWSKYNKIILKYHFAALPPISMEIHNQGEFNNIMPPRLYRCYKVSIPGI